jgi:hypothetical protein
MTAESVGFRCRTCGGHVDEAVLAAAWMDAVESIGLLGEDVVGFARAVVPDRADALQDVVVVANGDFVAHLCRELAWGAGELVVRWRYPFSLLAAASEGPPARDVLATWLAGLDGEIADGILQLLVSARKDRRMRRRPLGPCNVLTIPEALAELAMGDSDGLAWLHAEKLIRHPGRERRGSGRVLASELMEAIGRSGGAPKRLQAPTTLPLKRTDRF